MAGSCVENKGAREWIPIFISNDQETPCPERQEHEGTSGVVHRLTGKEFPHEHEANQFSIIGKVVSLPPS
jgi:hypothetical protein